MSILLALCACEKANPRAGARNWSAEKTEHAKARIEAFRAMARENPEGVVKDFGGAAAQEQFQKLTAELWANVVPVEGWRNFFSSAVYTLAAGEAHFLTAFYDPWSDVMLITQWREESPEQWRLADLEMFLGDFVRRPGDPPYNVRPGWIDNGQFPAVAVAELTQKTLDKFSERFGAAERASRSSAKWRSRLPTADKESTLGLNRVAAGKALENNTLAKLQLFRAEPVAGTIERAAEKLRAGKIDELLATAKETDQAAAELLKQQTTGAAPRLHLACWLPGPELSFAFLDTEPPATFFSVMLRTADAKEPKLARVDVVNHRVYRRYASAATSGKK